MHSVLNVAIYLKIYMIACLFLFFIEDNKRNQYKLTQCVFVLLAKEIQEKYINNLSINTSTNPGYIFLY